MLGKLGPSHHVFYFAMHRRRLWLEHLSAELMVRPGWPETKARLDKEHGDFLRLFPIEQTLGIKNQPPLERWIDDTPPDSFLNGLSEKLWLYEAKLVAKWLAQPLSPEDRKQLLSASKLWGRQLAQECQSAYPEKSALIRPKTVQGLYELIQNFFYGGDFQWKPLLRRRYSEFELQYELRRCPHRALDSRNERLIPQDAADFACALEAAMVADFARSLESGIRHSRRGRDTYCLDMFTIE